MFQLAFHLPYYVWRSSQKLHKDHRQNANGDPLRHSRDISFLNWKNCGSPGFLHEAQISCVVAGSDEWRWVAYCFVDTYFDAVEEGRESVLSYHDDKLGGIHADPFTYGITDADTPIRNPREYFLMVFRIRIAQVKREWQRMVEKIDESIREYEQVCSLFLLNLGLRDSSAMNSFQALVDKVGVATLKKAVVVSITAPIVLKTYLVFIFHGFLVH
jgi:hypothetical protein